MEITDLSKNEHFLIHIIREFDFLRYHYGYNICGIVYGAGKVPSLSFMNFVNRIKIHVIGDENYLYTVFIQKKRLFKIKKINISNYYNHFSSDMKNNTNYSLSEQSFFVKTHLTSIISGEMWIDELLKSLK